MLKPPRKTADYGLTKKIPPLFYSWAVPHRNSPLHTPHSEMYRLWMTSVTWINIPCSCFTLMSLLACRCCCFQVGHEPLPPTVGTTMFGRRVLYLPGFFSYGEWGAVNQRHVVSSCISGARDGDIRLFSAQHIVKVDGKTGLFRGLSPRIASSVLSTLVRGKVRQVTLYILLI